MEDRFHSNPSCVLIDRSGIVSWTLAGETSGSRRETSELLERLGALR